MKTLNEITGGPAFPLAASTGDPRDGVYCWRCGGLRETRCPKTDLNPSGYKPCQECKGTGYGESLETMLKRKGIVPSQGKETQ